MENDNDFKDEIDEVSKEETEDEEAIDNYNGGFPYGQNVDQDLATRIQNIRNNMQNFYGGPRDRKQESDENGSGGRGLDKKDGLNKENGSNGNSSDVNNNSSNNGSSSKKSPNESSTPDINNHSAEDLGNKISNNTTKNVAQAAGSEAAKKAAQEAGEEAVKQVATKAVTKTAVGKGVILVVAKFVGIALLIVLGILFIFSFFSYAYESLIGSISSFFGISEKKNDSIESTKYDNLLDSPKYQYYKKDTCDLDNYSEGACGCSYGDANCVALTHEQLIKVLKSENTCKIGNEFYDFWDNIVLGLSGGKFDDTCRLLRYVRGATDRYENAYKKYNLKLDNGLVVSSILNVYGSQNRDFAKENTESNTAFVEEINHYEIIQNIVNDGLVTKNDVDDLIKNSILEELYPYYTYRDGSCELSSKVDYKFSIDKFKIYMRYGAGENNAVLGINDSDFNAAGFLAIGNKKLLEKKTTESIFFSDSDAEKLSGSGWTYYKALNNAWSQTSEECRGESFFTERNMTDKKDIASLEQAVKDVYARGQFSPTSANIDYRIGSSNRSAYINFDYRAGFIYNKATMFKKSVDRGKTQYDPLETPKVIEKIALEIIDRKKSVNEVLFFENNEVDTLSEPTIDSSYISSNKFYWPIGSNKTTEVNGVTFATGTPASVSITSYYGNRKHPRTGVYKMHTGVDISGREGSTNVIAAQAGKVVQVNNGCSPGNYGCGGGYGNYIKISHSDGKYTLYAHLHKGSLTVSKGDQVAQGQVIAKVGNTGNSTGPHLHFEVRVSSTKRVNPLDYIDKKETRPAVSGNINVTAGADNKSTICNSLLDSGISQYATTALMVNIIGESAFNPECNTKGEDGTYGYGLLQWKGDKSLEELKKFAKEINSPYNSIGAQLNYAFYTMQHGSGGVKQAYDSLMDSSKGPKTMATDFCLLYAEPQNKETSCPERINKYYESINKYVTNGCKD